VVVADVHDDVVHAPCESAADAVKSELPKLRPVTVTESVPLKGRLVPANDTTGPSKLKISSAVPATAPTVTCKKGKADWMLALRHSTDVPEVHAAVLQEACPKTVLDVKS
jgi:hypothetical protein